MRGAVFETALRIERGRAITFSDFYKNSPKRVGEILIKIGDFPPLNEFQKRPKKAAGRDKKKKKKPHGKTIHAVEPTTQLPLQALLKDAPVTATMANDSVFTNLAPVVTNTPHVNADSQRVAITST